MATVKISLPTTAELEAGDITRWVLLANPGDDALLLQYYHRMGLFRVVVERDEHYSVRDLLGDCYNPAANPGIDPAQLAREEKRERSRIRRQGVWGVVVEVRRKSTDDWEHPNSDGLDSLWGNIGADFINSGYEPELMRAGLDWLEGNNAITEDPQSALVCASKKALLFLRRIRAEYPDVYPSMLGGSADSVTVMDELASALEEYDIPV